MTPALGHLILTIILALVLVFLGTLARHFLNSTPKRQAYPFTPSSHYQHYRNQARSIRRHLGWPSGRQWTKQYKAGPFSDLIRHLRANRYTAAA